MIKVKDTLRATVHLSFDGRVIKSYRGTDARTRFENEVKVLLFLETQRCPFVPLLLETSPARLRIVTSNCGMRVEYLDEVRRRELFAELEGYGVRHDDADQRNVTYRAADGRFCLIDFEFATLLKGLPDWDRDFPASPNLGHQDDTQVFVRSSATLGCMLESRWDSRCPIASTAVLRSQQFHPTCPA